MINRFRWAVALALVAGAQVTFSPAVRAQQPSADEGKKTVQVVDKTLVTEDGWQIAITYRNSIRGKEAPVVILLHQIGSDRLVYEGKEGFAERLSREGYAVVSVDLRKHGQSKSPAGGDDGKGRGTDSSNLRTVDYQRMVDNDLEAVKDFIYKEHQAKNLNMNKIAIVAPEKCAPIAINYALYDWLKRPYPDGPTLESSTPRGQDVRAMVLLSPQANIRGVPTGQAILQLRNPQWGISFLICYGTLDDSDKGDARKIYLKLAGVPENKDRMYLQAYHYKLRGTDLLRKSEVNCESDVIEFLKLHLLDVSGEWRDRRNRITGK